MTPITEFPITTREAGATGNELMTAATPAAARAAAELGDSATRDVGTTAGTVAAGDDSRLSSSVFVLDVKADYGAKGDGRAVPNAAMTSGSPILTSATMGWTADDVGKKVRVVGAGATDFALIATIVSRESATQVTLDTNAGSTVSNALCVCASDDTSAVQAAIDDAGLADSICRTVFFPPGIFFGNWTVGTEVAILGSGGGTFKNFDSPDGTELNDRSISGTVLMPVTTDPVLQYTRWFGNEIRRLCVTTGVRIRDQKQGEGITIGFGGANYTGSSGIIELCQVSGFLRGYVNDGAVDVVCNICAFVDSTTNVFYGGGLSIAPTDTGAFISCITGGVRCEYCFDIESRALTIIGGDHNLADKMMRLEGILSVTTLNCEQIKGSVFEIVSGTLTIAAGRFDTSAGTGPLIVALGPTVNVKVGNVVWTPPTASKRKSESVIYRTGGNEIPNELPRGYAIERYTDFTFADYLGADLTSHLYAQPGRQDRCLSFEDNFIKNADVSPYGELGWVTEQIGSHSGILARYTVPVAGGALGTMEITNSAANVDSSGRFSLPKGMMQIPNVASGSRGWRFSSIFRIQGAANTITRLGLYSVDASPTLIPAHGLGVRLDVASGDASLHFEKILSGVVTSVDTGLLISDFSSASAFYDVVIENTVEGLWCSVYKFPYSAIQKGRKVAEVSLDSPFPLAQYVAPVIIQGTSTAAFASVRLDRIKYEQVEY